ncbi:unnamed protein product [Paramecium pentaurelia]|uniref:Uncharacterized protein n=1 Tax=Paramecium pentaurelia TaxID=43138 RepID=A0A8S1VB14_9CILI|nr:unnamed protein product [Paramecium pentaurelia]
MFVFKILAKYVRKINARQFKMKLINLSIYFRFQTSFLILNQYREERHLRFSPRMPIQIYIICILESIRNSKEHILVGRLQGSDIQNIQQQYLRFICTQIAQKTKGTYQQMSYGLINYQVRCLINLDSKNYHKYYNCKRLNQILKNKQLKSYDQYSKQFIQSKQVSKLFNELDDQVILDQTYKDSRVLSRNQNVSMKQTDQSFFSREIITGQIDKKRTIYSQQCTIKFGELLKQSKDEIQSTQQVILKLRRFKKEERELQEKLKKIVIQRVFVEQLNNVIKNSKENKLILYIIHVI